MKKDIIKITVISVLAIALLGSAFMGINHLTLVYASHHIERIKLVTTEVNLEQLQKQEQTNFNLTVLEISLKNEVAEEELDIMGYSFVKPDNVLSIDEAAQIGAQYIYDMLGENIEGKFVAMNFFERDTYSRPYWQGLVGNSEEALESREYDFVFLIDAVTGERIGIDNHVGLNRSETILNNLSWNDSTDLSDEQVVNYTKVVNDFAELHFKNTAVNRIDFIGVDWLGAIRDDRGEFVPEWIARFNVIDDTGRRMAEAAITLESQQLRHFSTLVSDRLDLDSDKEIENLRPENSTIVEWGLTSGENILIVDNTELSQEVNPNMNHELTSYHLTIEEAAEIGAKLIYEEFGKSVDGMRFEKMFWHFHHGGREFWNGSVYDDEGKQLFFYVIDARTGDKIELYMSTEENWFLG